MKQIIILYIILLSTSFLICQPDNQWLIRQGQGKEASSTDGDNTYVSYSIPATGAYVNITNVQPPSLPFCLDAPPLQQNQFKIPRNDWFIIFRNLEYLVVNDMGYDEYTNTYSILVPNGYNPIEYLYLSNAYDANDPRNEISANTTLPTGNVLNHPGAPLQLKPTNTTDFSSIYSSLGVSQINYQLGGTNYPHRNYGENYCANQDILDSSDITFILKPNPGTMELCQGPKQFCYSLPSSINNDHLNFTAQSFKINEGYGNANNYLHLRSAGLNYGTIDFIDQEGEGNTFCLDLGLSNNSNNSFANFRCNVGPTAIGDSIQFYTICNGVDTIFYDHIQISAEAHDPNYVKVQCVFKECGKIYARYKVACFNDGDGPVNTNFTYNFTLPAAAIPSTMKLLKRMNCCNEVCYEESLNQGNQVMIGMFLINDNSSVNDGLYLPVNSDNDITSCDFQSYIEFIVELDIDENEIHSVPLQLGNPYTTFNNRPYPISTFIDDKKCVQDSCQYIGRKKVCYCLKYERINHEKCHSYCEDCTNCWCRLKRWVRSLFCGWGNTHNSHIQS